MHKQHPQTAYRKYAVLIGAIFENCDNFRPFMIDLQSVQSFIMDDWYAKNKEHHGSAQPLF